jgi:hypothetical protein
MNFYLLLMHITCHQTCVCACSLFSTSIKEGANTDGYSALQPGVNSGGFLKVSTFESNCFLLILRNNEGFF